VKISYTDIEDMIRELKDRCVHEVRIDEVIRDVQVMIPHGYSFPLRTYSVHVTANMTGEWEDGLVAEYSERVGSADDLAGEETRRELHSRAQGKAAVLRELLADEFLSVGSGRFEE
jgi:hypothetical protein